MVFLIPPKFSSCGIGTIQHFYSLIDVFRISRIFICRERQTTGTDCYIHTIIGVFILHGRQQLRVARTTMFRPCFQPQPYLDTQNITNTTEPSGRILLDTMKSSRSMMFVPAPSGCIPDKMLKPNTAGRERRIIATMLTITAFPRLQPFLSIE